MTLTLPEIREFYKDHQSDHVCSQHLKLLIGVVKLIQM